MKNFTDQLKTITSLRVELDELRNRGCSDATITHLESLIQRAYNYSKSVGNEPYFENNVRQTISKQLSSLLEYRSMKKKRESYWRATVDNFYTDLSNTLSFIEMSNRVQPSDTETPD